jgi:exopolyphosphatase/guanosine-5'-triphosphate,3'-diphosphate pyrophosphatase
MTEIVPRWEWRWFGHRLGPAESRLAALTPSGVQESDETYLLSGAGDNVKVRDALMDIKVLREVNCDGLEQWTPVMKAGFPLPASEVTRVFAALQLEPPPLQRADYSLQEFINELAVPGGRIRAISVHKRRTRYTLGGCMAELSEVVADGKPTRTVAVESEDAAAVIAAVRSLGLGGYVNTSYPRGLAALIDGEPSRYAVIDVGTNSVKFHLGERARDGTWRTVADRAEMTRLGEGGIRSSATPRSSGRRQRSRAWSMKRSDTGHWRRSRRAPPDCASHPTAKTSWLLSRRAPACAST